MTPLRRATTYAPIGEDLIASLMRRHGVDRERAVAIVAARRADFEANTEVWVNDAYQVHVRKLPGTAVHINIMRPDGDKLLQDWLDFQAIKDQLIGAKCEAVQLYPSGDRVFDNANHYHLWGTLDPSYRFPVGFC